LNDLRFRDLLAAGVPAEILSRQESQLIRSKSFLMKIACENSKQKKKLGLQVS